MIKPVGFRPTPVDQSLIDALIAKGDYKNTADLIRMAILSLAKDVLTDNERNAAIINGYEKEVAGRD